MAFPRTESDLSHKLMSLLVFCVGGGVGGGFVHCFIFLLFSFETVLRNEPLTSLWSPVWPWIYERVAMPCLDLLSARISGVCHHACLCSYASVCGRSMCMGGGGCLWVWRSHGNLGVQTKGTSPPFVWNRVSHWLIHPPGNLGQLEISGIHLSPIPSYYH